MPSRFRPSRRKALVDKLRAAGLRTTNARLAVLDVIYTATTPLTHLEVRERSGDDWDAATVYRNLVTLVEAGILTRTDHGDRRWRYEASSEESHDHPHFLCSACGEVRCLPETEVVLRGKAVLPASAGDGKLEIQLRGVCEACV